MSSPPAPVVLVASRHRPHEQLFMAWSSLIGFGYLTTAPVPQSLVSTLPGWLLTAWAALTAVSGVVTLLGCWWRGERGMRVELGGLLMNAGALAMFTAAVFTFAGYRALWSGGLAIAWAGANLWRCAQVAKDLRSIRGSR
jgi:hypothetical protein